MTTLNTTLLFSALTLAITVATAQASTMVTAKNGMTLYTFDNDKGAVSSCYDACATKWPPYMGKSTDSKSEGWTLSDRKDGTMQWAYDGKPVYFFEGDKKKGDAVGDGMNGSWHVIAE